MSPEGFGLLKKYHEHKGVPFDTVKPFIQQMTDLCATIHDEVNRQSKGPDDRTQFEINADENEARKNKLQNGKDALSDKNKGKSKLKSKVKGKVKGKGKAKPIPAPPPPVTQYKASATALTTDAIMARSLAMVEARLVWPHPLTCRALWRSWKISSVSSKNYKLKRTRKNASVPRRAPTIPVRRSACALLERP